MDSLQVIEAAAFAVALVAGARRLLPKLDGWAVVGAVLVVSLASGYHAFGLTREAGMFGFAVFVASYGGYNAVRKLLETGAHAVHALVTGTTVPPPPPLPGQSAAPKDGQS